MKLLTAIGSIAAGLVRLVDEMADAMTRSGRRCSPVDTERFTELINRKRHSGLSLEASRQLSEQVRNTRGGWDNCLNCGAAFENEGPAHRFCSYACYCDFGRSCFD